MKSKVPILLSVIGAVALADAGTNSAAAQQPGSSVDTLHLGALQTEAVTRDPRRQQLTLLESQSRLRLRSIADERLPDLTLGAQAQYQSDVATIPFELPGTSVATPPLDSYDARLNLRQPLLDPTRRHRVEVERARLAESQAGVRTSLFKLREQVTESYFAVLLLDAQRAELEAGIADLEARLVTARDRVRLGSALPSDAATLEAELLRRRQSIDEIDANRAASLAVLGELTGRSLTGDDVLALPDIGDDVARVRTELGELRERPEYDRFARSHELLERQKLSIVAQERPRLSAFGRAGYGRPGLNPLGRDFDSYWLAGLQVEWSPWNWGRSDRQREEIALQQRVLETEEAAFRKSLLRGTEADLAAMDRLVASSQSDDQIVALHEDILRETTFRFTEGVIGSAEYVDRQTDLLTARLTRATHRVELARARAHFLTFVGVEVR